MRKLLTFTTCIVVLIAIICAITTGVQARTLQEEWEESREIITIVIERGDSIDGYWAEYAPDWMDRYEYRKEIMELNNLDSCMIYAGDIIKLYIEGDK